MIYQIFVLSAKIVYKVSDSVLVVFAKCGNTGIESFFCLSESQLIINLSVVCMPVKEVLCSEPVKRE